MDLHAHCVVLLDLSRNVLIKVLLCPLRLVVSFPPSHAMQPLIMIICFWSALNQAWHFRSAMSLLHYRKMRYYCLKGAKNQMWVSFDHEVNIRVLLCCSNECPVSRKFMSLVETCVRYENIYKGKRCISLLCSLIHEWLEWEW